jgi:hypothetical protein
VKIFGMTRAEVNDRYGQLALNVRTGEDYSDADYYEMQLLVALRQRQDALAAVQNATRFADYYAAKLAKALYE